MSTYTRTFTRCDGCGLTNEFAYLPFTAPQIIRIGAFDIRFDICEVCDKAGRFYCRFCEHVHDDEHPCAEMERLNAEVEADRQSGEAYRP